jgi:hypothetical protein
MAVERREHRVALEILYAVDIGAMPLEDVLTQARDEVGVFGRGDLAAEEDPYEPDYPAIDTRADAPRPTDWALVERIVRGTLTAKSELDGGASARRGPASPRHERMGAAEPAGSRDHRGHQSRR